VNLSAFNLNLLVALHALLVERSVTRAARRCGVTQSSMSYSLARLRERFDDPLLVRRGTSLAPTAMATALAPRLEKMLGEVGALLEVREAFDPATSTRRFRIAASDMFQLVALPALLDGTLRDAPGIDLVVQSESKFVLERLASGALDLAIDAAVSTPPAGVAMREVLRQRYVCIVRKRPRGGTRLGLASFCALPHLLVGQDEDPGLVDRALETLGRTRRVAVRVPDYAAVGHVIASSELIATVPELVATTLARSLPLQVLALPFPLRDFGIALYWHERYANDPGTRWLREVLEAAVGDLRKARRRLL
jgi:DNA-binding transcriptional LysR family regulator